MDKLLRVAVLPLLLPWVSASIDSVFFYDDSPQSGYLPNITEYDYAGNFVTSYMLSEQSGDLSFMLIDNKREWAYYSTMGNGTTQPAILRTLLDGSGYTEDIVISGLWLPGFAADFDRDYLYYCATPPTGSIKMTFIRSYLDGSSPTTLFGFYDVTSIGIGSSMNGSGNFYFIEEERTSGGLAGIVILSVPLENPNATTSVVSVMDVKSPFQIIGADFMIVMIERDLILYSRLSYIGYTIDACRISTQTNFLLFNTSDITGKSTSQMQGMAVDRSSLTVYWSALEYAGVADANTTIYKSSLVLQPDGSPTLTSQIQLYRARQDHLREFNAIAVAPADLAVN